MTTDENPADVIEQRAAQAITACIGPDRKWSDCTPLLFARALHDAGLLADPADRDEHWLTKFREAQVELAQVKQVLREIDELRSRAEAKLRSARRDAAADWAGYFRTADSAVGCPILTISRVIELLESGHEPFGCSAALDGASEQ